MARLPLPTFVLVKKDLGKDFKPKTQGMTRAEYVKSIVDQPIVQTGRLRTDLPASAQIAQVHIPSHFATAASTGVSAAAAMRSMSVAMERLQRDLRNLVAACYHRKRADAASGRMVDPVGWACDAVGFTRSEIRDARIEVDWINSMFILEVDLVGSDWEPTYEIEMYEADGGELRSPFPLVVPVSLPADAGYLADTDARYVRHWIRYDLPF